MTCVFIFKRIVVFTVGDRRIRRAGKTRRAKRGAVFSGESVFERTARDSSRPVYRYGDNQSSHRHICPVQRVLCKSRRIRLFTPSAVYSRVSANEIYVIFFYIAL